MATLAQLRTMVRERCDLTGSQFVTDAELNTIINNAYAEEYTRLAMSAPGWGVERVGYTIASGNKEYFGSSGDLGTGRHIVHVLGMYYRNGSTWERMRRVAMDDFTFDDTPAPGQYRAYVVATRPPLTSDVSSTAGDVSPLIDEAIVLNASITVKAKSEESTSGLERILGRIQRSMTEAAVLTVRPGPIPGEARWSSRVWAATWNEFFIGATWP